MWYVSLFHQYVYIEQEFLFIISVKKEKNGKIVLDLTVKKVDDSIDINIITCGADTKDVGKGKCNESGKNSPGGKVKQTSSQMKTKTETLVIGSKTVIVRTESFVVDGEEIIQVFHDNELGMEK